MDLAIFCTIASSANGKSSELGRVTVLSSIFDSVFFSCSRGLSTILVDSLSLEGPKLSGGLARSTFFFLVRAEEFYHLIELKSCYPLPLGF